MQTMTVMEASEERASKIVQAATSPFEGKVFSKDGTAIAFDRIGNGPPVILVDGALCYRGMGQSGQLAELLARHFTVFTYDRRGRGGSGDTAPYAVEREVEDIAALLSEAGGAAFVWGMSSGAVLALEAANRLSGIKKLALYEAPFIVDDSRGTTEGDWVRIGAAVAADRRSDAVKLFLKSVGAPGFFIALMRLLPMWSKLKAVAHTLPYDGAIVKDHQRGKALPASQWASVTVPALVMDGGKSPVWMRHANRSLASILPNAQYRTLKGQTHMLKPKAHAPMLVEFFQRLDRGTLTLVSRSNPMQIRHVIIKVDEQDKALSFYTSIVGFVKRLDLPIGRILWLTVNWLWRNHGRTRSKQVPMARGIQS